MCDHLNTGEKEKENFQANDFIIHRVNNFAVLNNIKILNSKECSKLYTVVLGRLKFGIYNKSLLILPFQLEKY